MKIALLIHVHTNPSQVARLVSRLLHKDVDIYINVDGKVNAHEFENYIKDAFFIKNRVEVVWGRFSQLEQILNSFREISETHKPYTHILFISGLDYPLKPISQIVDILFNNKQNNYIDYHELKDDEWSMLMKKRYQYWHFLPQGDIRNNQYVKRLLTKLGFKRKYPFGKEYYGSCWFCLSMESIKYLLKYTENNANILNFFRYTGCSDELYIQSVLLNSPLKENMNNKIYRYFDWGEKGKSPKILTTDDYSKIKESKAWFARKLDLNQDSQIFDMLDYLNKPKK